MISYQLCCSCSLRYGYKAHTNHEYEEKTEEIRQQMTDREVVVTKDVKMCEERHVLLVGAFKHLLFSILFIPFYIE